MPEGFSFPAEQEIWTPLIPTSAAMARETPYARYAYGRLGDGASVEAARADVQTTGRRLAMAFPATNERVVPTVAGFDEWFVGAQSRAIYVGVWGAAVCVFLIVCGNIANLFVLQTIGRGNELRVRQALGATSSRLVRQVALEAGMLAVPGGAIAWWVMGLGVDLIRGSQVIPPMLAVQPDIVSFGSMWASGALVACGVGAAAAAQCLGRDGVGSPATSDRTTTASRRATRIVDGFVGLQVALAIVLLVSAGVLVRMLVGITTASAGVDAARVVTASLYLPPERYVSSEARLGFFRALDERLSAQPSIAAVGFGEVAPTERAPRRSLEIADSVAAGSEPAVPTTSVVVSPGLLSRDRSFDCRGAGSVVDRHLGHGRGARQSALCRATLAERFTARPPSALCTHRAGRRTWRVVDGGWCDIKHRAGRHHATAVRAGCLHPV